MGSYLYCPECSEYLGSLGGDRCSCGWKEVSFEQPPQRTWVELTDDEIDKAWRSVDYTKPWDVHRIDVARAIEAKFKEKNT